MVIDETVMKGLLEDGFGPVAFAKKGKGYSATIGEQDVAVTSEGNVYVAQAKTKVKWPATEDPDFDVDARVTDILRDVADDLPGVVDVTAAVRSSSLTATVYRDVRSGGPEDAAAAVKDAAAALRRATAGVERLRGLLEAQDELARTVRENPLPEPTQVEKPAASPARPSARPPPPSAAASGWTAVNAPGGDADDDLVYVEQAVDLYDPEGAGRIVGQAHPGRVFILVQERDGWAFIEDLDGGAGGWVDAAAVRRRA